MQTALRTEVEELGPRATGHPDVKRRIEQIEGKTIPDLETEKRAVQRQIEDLNVTIRNAEKHGNLKRKIENLRKQKQSLQEEIEHL